MKKIKLEKMTIRRQEEEDVVRNLEKEKLSSEKELKECEDRDNQLHIDLDELLKEQTDLTRELERIRQENADMVGPQIKKIEEEIVDAEKQANVVERAIASETKRKEDLIERQNSVRSRQQMLRTP